MSLFAFEITYYAAYSIFLLGASRGLRDNRSRASVLLMTVAVLINVVTCLLPMSGIHLINSSIGASREPLNAAIITGMIAVWVLYALALICWKNKKLTGFHLFIAVIEICWFIDVVLLIYGLYTVPT